MALFEKTSSDDVAALIAKKNYSKAIEVIKTQLRAGRPDPRLKNQLADVLILSGKEREAVPILMQLADEHAREGFAAKAVAVFKKIQRIDPGRRDVDAKLAVLIQKKQEQATASLSPASSAGFELGMEELGIEAPAGESAPLPFADDSAEMGVELEPEPQPEPEPPPPPPKPKPAPRPAPPTPTSRPAARPPARPPAPVVDRDLMLDTEPSPSFLAEAEPLDLTSTSEPLDLAPEPATPKPPKPAPPPVPRQPPARPPVRRPAPAPEPEPEPISIEPEPEPEPTAEPEIFLEPEAEAAAVTDPMTDDAFADELLAVIENAFPTTEEPAFSPEAAEPAAGTAQIVVSPLFKDFSVDEMVAVIQGLNLQTYEAGAIIITEGEPGNSLYMLTSGRVKCFKKNAERKQVLLGELDEGAFFGEVSILTGKPRTASIVAATNCELLELDRATLDGITKTHPHVRQVLREFAQERMRKKS